MRSSFKHGRISLPLEAKEDFDLLTLWPDRLSDDERAKIESIMRAAFGAFRGLDSDEAESMNWARRYWRENWRIYPCHAPEPETLDRDSLRESQSHFDERATALLQAVLAVATDADPDIYAPDRYDVLTGITLRAVRQSWAAARFPLLWTGELGSPIARAVVEAHIVMRWLLLREREDPEIYLSYKSYGRGRLKLLKLHADELSEANPDVEEIAEFAAALEAEVNQDLWEEFQPIDLGGSFSGRSTREMASDVGLEDAYRLWFAPASSDTHGEWPALDRYVLDRCLQLAHRGHRIARSTPNLPALGLADLVLDIAEQIAEDFLSAVAPSIGRRAAHSSSEEE